MGVGWKRDWAGVSAANADPVVLSGVAITPGNWVVAGIRVPSGTTITPPSPFVLVTSEDNGVSKLETFAGKSVLGETSFSFSHNNAAATAKLGVLSEMQVIAAADAVDGMADAQTASGTSCSTGTTGITVQADEMAIAFVTFPGGSVTTPVCADGFTNGAEATVGSIRLLLAWKVLSAVGAQVGTWSWVTARTSISAIFTLKGVAGGPAGLVNSGLLGAGLVNGGLVE